MIVCSCNVLSDKDILATLASEDSGRPRSPIGAYRCLGCAPQCGRCLTTVRALLAQARVAGCDVGCAVCPGGHDEHHHQPANDTPAPAPYRVAAE